MRDGRTGRSLTGILPGRFCCGRVAAISFGFFRAGGETRPWRYENGQVRAGTAGELAAERAEIEANTPPPAPTDAQRIAELAEENRVLKGQVAASQENAVILEECLVEMAGVVYA